MIKMSVEDSGFKAKISELAILQSKGLEETVKDVARRFVKQVVLNTPPMISNKSASVAKREWEQKLSENYQNKPYVRGSWLSRAEMKRVLQAKKKQLGRMSAGWLIAVELLQAKVPAWVKRHGNKEGICRVVRGDDQFSVTVANSVPYGMGLLQPRAAFALKRVQQGIEGNLRVMKRKLLRSIK